jgi:hypothetical protein
LAKRELDCSFRTTRKDNRDNQAADVQRDSIFIPESMHYAEAFDRRNCLSDLDKQLRKTAGS